MAAPEDSAAITVLLVDDEATLREPLVDYLVGQGFVVLEAESAAAARSLLREKRADIALVDIMMPGEDGLSLTRHLIEAQHLPTILLTAMGEATDRIVGLEIGADDYLGKPFNPRELAARIRAVLRRGGGGDAAQADAAPTRFTFEGFTVDPERRLATDPDGAEVVLTGAEFDLLMIFLERPGRVLSRDILMDLLHGRTADPFDRSVDVTMSRLRRKFNDGGVFRLFKTVRNGGYQFAARVERSEAAPGTGDGQP